MIEEEQQRADLADALSDVFKRYDQRHLSMLLLPEHRDDQHDSVLIVYLREDSFDPLDIYLAPVRQNKLFRHVIVFLRSNSAATVQTVMQKTFSALGIIKAEEETIITEDKRIMRKKHAWSLLHTLNLMSKFFICYWEDEDDPMPITFRIFIVTETEQLGVLKTVSITDQTFMESLTEADGKTPLRWGGIPLWKTFRMWGAQYQKKHCNLKPLREQLRQNNLYISSLVFNKKNQN